ncbi:hypothetical protein WKI68_44390 [Streptomyces sp. MS1.HAVA.3]|uniref:Uncharacterized protein n=1 Tax=Streptomyces caledonius TaxID=3134107 RepID=A0ABU8UET6_9ACTN
MFGSRVQGGQRAQRVLGRRRRVDRRRDPLAQAVEVVGVEAVVEQRPACTVGWGDPVVAAAVLRGGQLADDGVEDRRDVGVPVDVADHVHGGVTNGQFFLSEAVEEREQAWHRQREAKIDAVDLRRRHLPEASNEVRVVGAARVDQQGLGDVVAVVLAQMGGLGRLVDECLWVAEQVDQLVGVIGGDRRSGVHRPDDAARLVAHIVCARAAISLEQQLVGEHAFGSGWGAGHCLTLWHGNQAARSAVGCLNTSLSTRSPSAPMGPATPTAGTSARRSDPASTVGRQTPHLTKSVLNTL